MTLPASLADMNIAVVNIANLTDASHAVQADIAEFAGGQTDLRQTLVGFLRHQLRSHASGADKLCTAAGVELDVVDDRTNGDIGDRQAVARLDVRAGGGDDLIAGLQTDGSQDISQFAIFIIGENIVFFASCSKRRCLFCE